MHVVLLPVMEHAIIKKHIHTYIYTYTHTYTHT